MSRFSNVVVLCFAVAVAFWGWSRKPIAPPASHPASQTSKAVSAPFAQMPAARDEAILAQYANIVASFTEPVKAPPVKAPAKINLPPKPLQVVSPQSSPPPQHRSFDLMGEESRRILRTAVKAYQAKLAVLSDNLANVHTTAFKCSRVLFESVALRNVKLPGTIDATGKPTAVGIAIGQGVRIASVQTDFKQGSMIQTGNSLDLAIEGRGFFEVTDPNDGQPLYTRAGNFSLNANGEIVIGSATTGRVLQPAITIPSDATQVSITPEGLVQVKQPGSTTLNQVGSMQLATFVNPEGLKKLGENLYAETDASNTPTLTTAGQQGVGRIRQGCLEASNVEPVVILLEIAETVRLLRSTVRLLGMQADEWFDAEHR